MLRKILHFYWRLTRGLTLGVRGVVLDSDGRVLLVRHGYTPGWHFPGGGVEPGESLIDALARELAEEGNVRLTGAPRLHGVFLDRTSPRDHVALFVVHEFDWQGPKRPNWEIPEARFFPFDRLPEGTTEGTRRRLQEILSGTGPDPRW
jgi:8-oxo-dGTP pyrophosphatase MutT (NUDIX family)